MKSEPIAGACQNQGPCSSGFAIATQKTPHATQTAASATTQVRWAFSTPGTSRRTSAVIPAVRKSTPASLRDPAPPRRYGSEPPSRPPPVCEFWRSYRHFSRASVAECELGLFAHHVRGPGRCEGHLRVHRANPVELADELLDLLRHLRPDRAAGGGEGEAHEDVAVLDLDAVDQPELHEVEPQLRVDHVRERLLDVIHGHSCHGTRIVGSGGASLGAGSPLPAGPDRGAVRHLSGR